MSIKDWENGRKLNLRDPDIEDMFAIDFDYTSLDRMTNSELMDLESKRSRNKINQAR